MKERDMMYGSYYQGTPGNNMYSNFGYQGPPGSLFQMQNPYMNNTGYANNNYTNSYLENNPFADINNRLNELEIKVSNIEKKVNRYKNFKDDDDSIYML